MRLLRNKRRGNLVVYDEKLLELGTYEEYFPPRPDAEDEVGVTDALVLCVEKNGVTTEHQL